MDTPPPPLPSLPPFPPAGAPWPMVPAYQPVVDAEHLKLLAIFHYIVGAFAILFSSLFIFHIVMGLTVLAQPDFLEKQPHASPAMVSPSPVPAASPDETAAPDDATPALTTNEQLRRTTGIEFPGNKMFGYMFVGMGSAMVLIGWTFGTLTIFSGRSIARRRRRIFSMVIAGFNCLQFPFGTALGVFTFIVLGRPSVAALYAANHRKDAA